MGFGSPTSSVHPRTSQSLHGPRRSRPLLSVLPQPARATRAFDAQPSRHEGGEPLAGARQVPRARHRAARGSSLAARWWLRESQRRCVLRKRAAPVPPGEMPPRLPRQIPRVASPRTKAGSWRGPTPAAPRPPRATALAVVCCASRAPRRSDRQHARSRWAEYDAGPETPAPFPSSRREDFLDGPFVRLPGERVRERLRRPDRIAPALSCKQRSSAPASSQRCGRGFPERSPYTMLIIS